MTDARHQDTRQEARDLSIDRGLDARAESIQMAKGEAGVYSREAKLAIENETVQELIGVASEVNFAMKVT